MAFPELGRQRLRPVVHNNPQTCQWQVMACDLPIHKLIAWLFRSRLNYNKWDTLEVSSLRSIHFLSPIGCSKLHSGQHPADSQLTTARILPIQLSDDSDIEVHPNVDKKSMIR